MCISSKLNQITNTLKKLNNSWNQTYKYLRIVINESYLICKRYSMFDLLKKAHMFEQDKKVSGKNGTLFKTFEK